MSDLERSSNDRAFRHRPRTRPARTGQEENDTLGKKLTPRGLLLRSKQRAESLDLALKPGTADFESVALSLRVFELGFQSAHLIYAFLAIAASRHCVGFSLFNA
jgi:hypothetical protein